MEAITNFDLLSYEVKAIIDSNARPPTMKKVPTHNDILMNTFTSEILSSSTNTFFLSQPLNLQLKNSPISIFHGNNQNPCNFKLSSGTGSEVGTSENNAINGDNIVTKLLPNHDSQELQAQKNKFKTRRTQTMKLVPTIHQNLLKKRSYSETSSSSSSILNEQSLTKQMSNSSNSFSGGLIGTTYKEGTNDNSIGNFGAMCSNQGTNVEQSLTQQNSSSFSLHGSQNHNFMQSNSSSFGGFIRTASQAATKDNPIGNYGAMLDNHSGNVEDSMLLRTGQDQQNQLNVNINNELSHDHFNNNQNLQHNPSLSIDDFSLPDLPSDFEVQLSPLLGTNLQDFDAPQEQIQSDVEINNELHDLLLNNQPFPQNPNPTLVHHDTQNLGLQNSITSNVPNENSSNSYFFSSFLNLCSETNTPSLSQVLEDLDESHLFSNDSFQNPSSETNAASQDGLDLGQFVTNLDDVYQNPISETNTGSQVRMNGSQNDLDISDYLGET
ncbi:hypothetical protein TanjilG_19829 [Lupinus angustifolius]|uniref:Uncharacterized protein n=1 Tax=Lupinus angustifolius TaxID=3871 RepID=A0A1J7GXJ8_LUPAN|nr:hypothetical protein TanjilG_19829 [Lupinus angustifolius]